MNKLQAVKGRGVADAVLRKMLPKFVCTYSLLLRVLVVSTIINIFRDRITLEYIGI